MSKSKRRVSVLVAPSAVAVVGDTPTPAAKVDTRPAHLSRPAKILISAFVAFHITGIAIWLLPKSHFQETFVEPFRQYINITGMWQTWSVFAPDPKTWNIYCTARIYYKDGTRSEWTFPRIDKLDLVERMYKERYRKWMSEGLVDNKNAIIWPDCAKWIARNHSVKGKVPIAVDLIKHWAYIEPPATGIGKPSPEPNQEYTFYRHMLAAGDLK
jgi:hypothetical protein